MHCSKLRDEVFSVIYSGISCLGLFFFFSSDCCTSFWLLMMPCAQGAFSLALNVFVVRMLRPFDIYLLIARGFARFKFIFSRF